MKNEIYYDSYNEQIMVGDLLHIVAGNQYSGTVNVINGIMYLETVFFNKPLHEHLSAIDFQYCEIDKERVSDEIDPEGLPF